MLDWLATCDLQSATVVAGWIESRDDLDHTEPYCRTCHQWIGHFLGMDSWQHYLDDPAPGGHSTTLATSPTRPGASRLAGRCPGGRAHHPARPGHRR